MLVQITNIGRRPIGIAGVEGELKDGNQISMAVDGLPKILQPYEIFGSMSLVKQHILEKIQTGEITKLWVKDTKNKRWFLSEEEWERLHETADYIAFQKHQ
jgi:hypothetical protein